MTGARSDNLERTWELNPADLLRLFQQISHLIAGSSHPPDILSGAAVRLTALLPIDRCMFLLRVDDEDFGRSTSELHLKVIAEACGNGFQQLGERQYQLTSGSEVARMLNAGKPLPLMDVTGGFSGQYRTRQFCL